jgi:hypothetical protein
VCRNIRLKQPLLPVQLELVRADLNRQQVASFQRDKGAVEEHHLYDQLAGYINLHSNSKLLCEEDAACLPMSRSTARPRACYTARSDSTSSAAVHFLHVQYRARGPQTESTTECCSAWSSSRSRGTGRRSSRRPRWTSRHCQRACCTKSIRHLTRVPPGRRRPPTNRRRSGMSR